MFDEAVSTGSLDTVFSDLGVVAAALQSSKELQLLYKSPIVKGPKKQAITQALFSGKVTQTTANFLSLVVTQGREAYLSNILASFNRLYNQTKGISEVTVTTATELDADNEQKIASFIKQQSGYPNVKINKKVDASIMGGFIIDFGGKWYDNSVRYKLSKVEHPHKPKLGE